MLLVEVNVTLAGPHPIINSIAAKGDFLVFFGVDFFSGLLENANDKLGRLGGSEQFMTLLQ